MIYYTLCIIYYTSFILAEKIFRFWSFIILTNIIQVAVFSEFNSLAQNLLRKSFSRLVGNLFPFFANFDFFNFLQVVIFFGVASFFQTLAQRL